MLEIIAALSIFAALFVLFMLSKIDLEEGILPNEFVFSFFCLGIVFHFTTTFQHLSPQDMAIGAVLGSGILLAIRVVANWYYKDDTLGLGDVKLLGAAGVWLGPHYTLIALIAGAIAGGLHGLVLAILELKKTKSWPDFSKFSLPAGPGFIVGIMIAAALLLKDFPNELWSALLQSELLQ